MRPCRAPVRCLAMTYRNMHVRSGLTAIAAVLALSSTPLAAQETTAPDPVTESPSEPAPAADPLAPEPTSSEPTVSEPEATERATTPPPTTRRTTTRARTAASNRTPAPPARAAAPAPVPQASEAAADPMAAPPAPMDPAAMPMAEPAAPPVVEEAPPANELMADETLPIAGAAGLGLLALTGLGLAIGRRRRRGEEMEHSLANQKYLDEHPDAETSHADEPAFVRAGPPAAMAASTLPEAEVLTDVPRTKLPSGFDLSRFGPHVRAAYMGPTPDNPSLSLKYRLRRAAAMDQRAQVEGRAPMPMEKKPEPIRQPVKQPAWNMNGEGFMLRRAGSSGQPARPAFQK